MQAIRIAAGAASGNAIGGGHLPVCDRFGEAVFPSLAFPAKRGRSVQLVAATPAPRASRDRFRMQSGRNQRFRSDKYRAAGWGRSFRHAARIRPIPGAAGCGAVCDLALPQLLPARSVSRIAIAPIRSASAPVSRIKIPISRRAGPASSGTAASNTPRANGTGRQSEARKSDFGQLQIAIFERASCMATAMTVSPLHRCAARDGDGADGRRPP